MTEELGFFSSYSRVSFAVFSSQFPFTTVSSDPLFIFCFSLFTASMRRSVVIHSTSSFLSRTRELLLEFATSFEEADELIIPDIYFSRDKKEDVEYMTTELLIDAVKSEKQKMKSGSEETVVNGN